MTEFQELVKDAPKFASMERGELVAYAYAMYAAGTKVDVENAKLRELAEKAWKSAERLCQAFDGPCRDDGVTIDKPCPMAERDKLRELVRAAYNCTNAGPSCLECRIVAGGCTLLSAMRELGIEAG